MAEYDDNQSTKKLITVVLSELEQMLHAKNDSYGDSVLMPMRVFSRANAIEQINVRIDDKLSRIFRGSEHPGDDTLQDLAGYLVLLLVAKRSPLV